MALTSTVLSKLEQAIKQADPTTITGVQILAESACTVKKMEEGCKTAEVENALKLEGKNLLATVNKDGEFNDDGIFKIKEENGEKKLIGVLDVNMDTKDISMNTKPITIHTLDVFEDGKCVALFEFKGNAVDTGGIYNGTWKGTPNYVDGKIGITASFDGSSSIRLRKEIYDAKQIDYPIAISAWVYLKAGETDAVVYNTGGTSNGLGFGIRDNKIYGVVQKNNIIDTLYGNTQLENEVWYFLTMVFDGSTKEMKLYVNGELNISKIMRIYPGKRVGYPFIGGIKGGDTFYDGPHERRTGCIIDHVRFFKDKLLSEEEIQKLYKEGA